MLAGNAFVVLKKHKIRCNKTYYPKKESEAHCLDEPRIIFLFEIFRKLLTLFRGHRRCQ